MDVNPLNWSREVYFREACDSVNTVVDEGDTPRKSKWVVGSVVPCRVLQRSWGEVEVPLDEFALSCARQPQLLLYKVAQAQYVDGKTSKRRHEYSQNQYIEL
jgi:hypothetical protein